MEKNRNLSHGSIENLAGMRFPANGRLFTGELRHAHCEAQAR